MALGKEHQEKLEAVFSAYPGLTANQYGQMITNQAMLSEAFENAVFDYLCDNGLMYRDNVTQATHFFPAPFVSEE